MRKFLTFFKKVLISIAKLLKNRWFLAPAIIVLLALGLFIALKSYIAPSPTDFSQRKEFIQLLAQILGGVLLLIGLYLTWRRITATERNVEVAREGQITERFTRAIDQLGSNRLEVRLGGIYALERIARDSEKDHWQIMEVLTAYIRKNAPWKKEHNPEEAMLRPPPPPTTDIQAILTVIGRRKRTYGKGEDQRLNLRMTDLRSANLKNAHLEGAELFALLSRADLTGAHLKGAVLVNTHLEKANLKNAHLEEADLRGAKLNGAELYKACLLNTRLQGVNLENAYLSEACLEKADLRRAHLEGALLDGTHLEDANLSSAHLKEADLTGADLWQAKLIQADLEYVVLVEAHLEKSDLRRARLIGANLEGAHLEGADLRNVTGLTREQIESAYINVNTKLPDYLQTPAKPKKRGKQEGIKKGTTSKRR